MRLCAAGTKLCEPANKRGVHVRTVATEPCVRCQPSEGGLGFRVWGFGFSVQGWELGFWIMGFGFWGLVVGV